MDLRHHARLLPGCATFALRQAGYSGAAGDATIGVEEDNYIALFVVKDGEEHLVADVLRVVFDCDVGCGADRGEERRERGVAGELEVVREEGVVGGVLGGPWDDDMVRRGVVGSY
jgi:hypothetical protein